MGRLPRRKLGRSVYHIYNRSANNMWILESDEMKEAFLNLVKKFSIKYSLNFYHYCIMSNHFHFAIEGDISDISALMRSVCSRFTMLYHTKVKGYGSLWQPRYKSVLVQKDGYLSRLGRYIELNPIRAKMIDFSHLAEYPWSSAKFYLTGQADELINPLEHPYHKQWFSYETQSRSPTEESLSFNQDLRE